MGAGRDDERADCVAQVLCRVVVCEQRQGAWPIEFEAAGCVGQACLAHAREDEREQVHRPFAWASRPVVAFAGEARADHHVRALEGGRLNEGLDLRRVVLSVRVELAGVLVPHALGVLEAGAHGSADPQVERQVKHGHPGRARDVGGRVRGPVGYDQDVREGRFFNLHGFEDAREHLLFVPRGDDDEEA